MITNDYFIALTLAGSLRRCLNTQPIRLRGEHSAILSTFINLSFVIKIIVLSIFEWRFYTGFTVHAKWPNPHRDFVILVQKELLTDIDVKV